MERVGPLQLLAVGFEGEGRPPQAVRALLQQCGRTVGGRLFDALVVAKDRTGVLRPQPLDEGTTVDDLGVSPLWNLLAGTNGGHSGDAALDVRQAGERGLDLEAVEHLVYEIEPGTSAVLALVDDQWAAELVDAAVVSGGVPITYGCLEPETMLVIGPAVAHAATRRDAAERAERARGADLAAWLRSSGGREQTLVADVLAALVRAAVIDEQDQARGIDALIEAGILSPGQPPAAVLRRRDQSL